ncbi:uncharacterized protein LOC142327839 [Lycorma delicatula]|uniref:uncharacterized protein LOC142327839 n=1 Tax=Lycorma delicatula TaxID=130591 RepID=UPI003F5106C7
MNCGRIILHQVIVLLVVFLFFDNLHISELRPQHPDQFSSGVLYNLPDQSTQFSIIPENIGHPIPLDDNTRDINHFNNFDTNGEEIPVAVIENHKQRGHVSYTSSLAEELESASIEDTDDEAIPGEPQHDYPVYEGIPQTAFSCTGKHVPAYYADVEARCQVFHICDVGGQKHSFLCPNGSVFNQKYLVCDWWYDFTCDNAENLFNKQIVPTEINSVPPKIENDKIFVNNNNEGFSSQVPSNEFNNYQNNNEFFINHEANQNGFEFPNTQIDTPQQIYTDNNAYIPQNDIFHGAETGFPGRDFIPQNTNGNNNDNKNENSDDKINKDRNDGYNSQNQKNKYTEENVDKLIKPSNDNIQTNSNNNINDNGNRKQQKAGRKGNDFSPQYRNNAGGNFQNNEEINNPNRQSDARNNNNNINLNFPVAYPNGQTQGNENIDVSRHQNQPQINFAPHYN